MAVSLMTMDPSHPCDAGTERRRVLADQVNVAWGMDSGVGYYCCPFATVVPFCRIVSTWFWPSTR